MTKTNIVQTNGQNEKVKNLETRLKYGDYESLAAILKCSRDAARKRFKRGNTQAIEAMEKIVNTRDQLIESSNNSTENYGD